MALEIISYGAFWSKLSFPPPLRAEISKQLRSSIDPNSHLGRLLSSNAPEETTLVKLLDDKSFVRQYKASIIDEALYDEDEDVDEEDSESITMRRVTTLKHLMYCRQANTLQALKNRYWLPTQKIRLYSNVEPR